MASDAHQDDYENLRQRLEEAEETLRAIRNGEVDALVVTGADGERVFTLQGADHPYRVLIESMQQGAATLGTEGTVLYCNRRFAELVDRPQERVIGAASADFLPPSLRAPFSTLLHCSRSESCQGEFAFESPTGAWMPVHLAISPLKFETEVALCLVATDLTQQKEHQDLQLVSRRKDEFLAMLAHELRNPLAPIRNALYLLRTGDVSSLSSEDVQSMMERQVDHLARLIDDLMDVSRIASGKVELRLELVDVTTALNQAVEVCRPLMEQKHHTLTVELPDEPVSLMADPTRLEQILDNLLTNAAKYTDPGGQITLSAHREGDFAVIGVRDSGIGIAPGKLHQVFELFVQVERRLDRSQGGLGLGLSLVRSLVEMHGGTVTAFSEGIGRGSVFQVRFPIRSVETRFASKQSNRHRRDRSPLPRRRVLVVDDNVDSASSMCLILGRMWNQDVQVAHDGEEAIEAALDFLPHVILLDIGLPTMSGFKVAETLRRHSWPERPMIVAMTGLGQDDDLRRSQESGFDHHLVKPLDLEVLRELLASWSGKVDPTIGLREDHPRLSSE